MSWYNCTLKNTFFSFYLSIELSGNLYLHRVPSQYLLHDAFYKHQAHQSFPPDLEMGFGFEVI